MHRRRGVLHPGITSVLALLLAARVASAGGGSIDDEPPPIAVIAIDITGDAAPELREHIEAAVQFGLERAGVPAMMLADVRAAIGKQQDLLGCTSTTCLERIGQATGAERFVAVRISASGASYEIAIELLHADADGAVEGRRIGSCAVCTIAELNEQVADLAHSVVAVGPESPRKIEVVSDPPGATLTVGESLSGTSPLTGELAPGEYRVEATLAGHTGAEQTITVTAETDAVQRFAIELVSAGEHRPPPATPPGPFRYGWMKWAAIGGSVAALSAGFAFLAMDGDPTCTPAVEGAECERVYTTGGLALGTTVLGVALAGVGGWMIWHDLKVDRAHERDHRIKAIGLAPTRGGAMASFALGF